MNTSPLGAWIKGLRNREIFLEGFYQLLDNALYETEREGAKKKKEVQVLVSVDKSLSEISDSEYEIFLKDFYSGKLKDLIVIGKYVDPEGNEDFITILKAESPKSTET